MSVKRICGRIGLALGTVMAVGIVFSPVALCHAQGFENQPGRAWRKGNATEANVIQLTIDNVKMNAEPASFTGKVSIRSNNQWLPLNEPISGTCQSYGDNMSFSGTAQVSGGTVIVRGFYSAGADTFSTDDDQVFVYYLSNVGPETDPCDPDDDVLESELEIPLP